MESIRYPLISEYMRAFLAAKEAANLNLNEVEPVSLPGAQARKNMGAAEAERLARVIRGLVDQDGAAVILTGPPEHQEKFVALAEDEGDAIGVKADEFYEVIAAAIEPSLSPQRAFVMETGFALYAALMNLAQRLNIESFIMPQHAPFLNQTFADHAAVVDLVRTLVRGANGDEFNAIYMTQKVFEQVITTEYESNVVAVVVSGAPQAEVEGLAAVLFGGHTLTHSVQDPPESNDIVLAARKLKSFWTRALTVQTALNAEKARAAKAQKKASTDATNTVSDEATQENS